MISFIYISIFNDKFITNYYFICKLYEYSTCRLYNLSLVVLPFYTYAMEFKSMGAKSKIISTINNTNYRVAKLNKKFVDMIKNLSILSESNMVFNEKVNILASKRDILEKMFLLQ